MATEKINSVYHTSDRSASADSEIGPITVSSSFITASTIDELSAAGLTPAEVERASRGKATCVVNGDGNVYAIIGTAYLDATMYSINLMMNTTIYTVSVLGTTLTITHSTLSTQ